MSPTRRPLAATAVAVLLVACAGTEPETDVDPPAETTVDDGELEDGNGVDDGEPADGADVDDDPTDTDLAAEVEQAVADLAGATGVDPADIEVRRAERVTWSDGSLGCPEPGMMYTQALVPGFRIVLELDGSEVAYHGADGAEPVRCDDPQPPSDPGS